MAPSSIVSIAILVVALVLCIFMHATTMVNAAVSMTASKSPALELEAKALMETRWRTTGTFNGTSLSHCQWNGITCNADGSVTEITMTGLYQGDEISKLNFSSFPNMVRLDLSDMGLWGSIPHEIGTLSKLTYLDLSQNALEGEMPVSLANLTQLVIFNIFYNTINGSIPFSLGNLTNLVTLSLDWNKISDSIHFSLSNLTNLVTLSLDWNEIGGFIPSFLDNLTNLVTLSLDWNGIGGSIPSSLGNLTNLVTLSLNLNQIGGSIPSSLGNLTNLVTLSLNLNRINGSIPSSLGTLTNLVTLSLSNNNLSGFIPLSISHLYSLETLSLSWNQISGSILEEIIGCRILRYLSLSHNYFNGSVPSKIGNLNLLNTIDLSHNNITGEIPIELGSLEYLELLDLSYNNFIGNIPNFSIFIIEINFSYNSLHGMIPTGCLKFSPYKFIGNKDLCGYMEGFPPCLPSSLQGPHNNRPIVHEIKFLVLGIFPVLVILGVFLFRSKVKKTKSDPMETKNGDLFSIWNYDGKIAYEDIIKATEDFDIRYCIETGSYGSFYKAQLPNGKVIVLKKLHRLEAEDLTFHKSFKNEIKMLTKVWHRNIVKLHGLCLHNRCMFFIYEHMEMGSLFFVLSNDVEAVELDWMKRMTIIKSIAHTLSYLHHECVQVIVHRDISINNILLNSKGVFVWR